jgi:ribosome-binding factor A
VTAGAQRKARLEHAIRERLQEMIAADVRDPRVRAATMLTVTRVELNVDNSVARVYVSVVGDDATVDGVMTGLGKAAGFLRGPLGRDLGVQRPPELRFLHDATIDMSEKLAAIVRDDEAKARAAGRDAGGDAAPTPPAEKP